jgi:hypothetical protein
MLVARISLPVNFPQHGFERTPAVQREARDHIEHRPG